jgi:hypothetical protein
MFTVAMAGHSEIRWDADAVVSCLAEVGVHDELLVVYGSPRWSGYGRQALVDGLVDQPPRHHVIAVHIGQHGAGLARRDVLLLDQLMQSGSLPIVVTPASAVNDITAEITSGLRTDRVLRVHCTAGGAGVHEVWHRPLLPS